MADSASNQRTIGAYRIDAQVRVDSGGDVFEARHLPSGQPVSIRLLPAERLAMPGFREQFEREMRAAASLYHHHVIELYEFGVNEGVAFIISELPGGGSLRDVLKQRQLPLRLGIELARQTAVALSAAHARGMAHGALKPECLLLFPETGGGYLLKVGDFGLARLLAPDAVNPAVYRAPELQGGDATPAADLYALGAILFEVAAGVPPSAASAPALRQVRPDAPAELEALVARCLAADPGERIGSADELATALEALVGDMAPRLSAAAAADATVIEALPSPEDATQAGPIATPAPHDATLAAAIVTPGEATVIEPVPPSAAPASEPAPPSEATVIEPAPTGAVADATAALFADEEKVEAAAPPPGAAPTSEPPQFTDATATLPPVPSGDATVIEPAPIAPPPPGDATVIEPAPVAPPPPGDAMAIEPPPAAPIASESILSDEAVTILPEPVPAINTPLPAASATQALLVSTPPPGFPVLPPSSTMPQVQVLDSQGAPIQLVSLTGDGLAIGRSASNDLVLTDESVSDEHAFIDWDGRQITVIDQDSKNGTILAGMRLAPQERQLWEGGAPVRIGVYWLRLVPALTQAASVIAPAVLGVAGPAAGAAVTPQRGAPAAPAGRTPGSVTPSFGAPAVAGPTAAVPQGGGGITQTPSAGLPRGAAAVAEAPSPAPPTAGMPEGMGVTQPPLGSNRYGIELEQDVMTLTPGMPSVLRMTLHNYSDNVDHLKVEVRGVPETWIQGPAPEPQLLPNGRTPVALNINVPRTPENRAGPYPVMLYARSRSRPNEAGVAQATWNVQSFTEHRLELKPRRVVGWRKGSYNLTLTNAGNVPSRYTLTGEDDEQALDFGLSQEAVALEPGAALKHRLTVRGPARWLGAAQPRSFSIHARTEKRSESQTSSAQFVQRPLIPTWIVPIVLLAALGFFYWASRPPVIRNARFDPSPQIAGQPARLSYEVDNANRVELQPIGVEAPAATGRRSFEFLDATAIPRDLSILAVSRFGVRLEVPVEAAIVTPTPTLAPTATPEPPTPVPPTEVLPAPTAAVEPTVIVEPPQPPPVVVETTPTPEIVLSDLVEFTCETGARIVITGTGPPRESFLLYFGRRAVSGGSIAANGTYRIEMLVGRERPGDYPVSVRLRLSDRPLPIWTYQYSSDPLVTLATTVTSTTPTQLMCVVEREAPTPTIAP